jgi:DNA-binding response OmpR family regulator
MSVMTLGLASEQTILVIEDDPHIADLIELYLREAGFRVLQAASGERGLEVLVHQTCRLAVIDIGLPGIDGFEVVRRIRIRSAIPVLFLTARDGEIDRVLGLELGADDYVTKPFSPRELVARVKAILRRGMRRADSTPTTFQLGDGIVLDTVRREATIDRTVVSLATKEFDLLAHFARNTGIALTRQQLLDAVWGVDFFGDDRTVDVHVGQIRKKLGDSLPLATVWGIGYRLG